MDLEKIQSQLKSHIRQHQVLVQEMKKDPQNVEIQRKLESLQEEFASLREKQTLVVQQLKQNIKPKQERHSSGQKYPQPFPGRVMVAGFEAAPIRGTTRIQNSFQIGQNSIIKTSTMNTVAVPKLTPPLALSLNMARNSVPNAPASPMMLQNVPHGIRRPFTAQLPSRISNKSFTHIKSEPVSPRSPRPVFKKPAMVTTGMQTMPSLKVDSTRLKPILPRPEASKMKISLGIQTSKPTEVVKQEREKLNFLSTLGLMTVTRYKEINSQKHERKRRTSAIFSPYSSFQFFEPEPKKSNVGIKRGRGRPPKNSDGSLKSPLSPSPTLAPVNGFKIPTAENLTNDKTSERLSLSPSPPSKDGEHEDDCVVCNQTGEVLMCDTCILVYHLKCLSPPLTKVPSGMWMCPKCQETCNNKEPMEWPGALAIAHSYLKHIAVKDKEKEKLLRRNQELKLQELKLRKKGNEFHNAILAQMQRHTMVVDSTRETQQKLQRLKNFINAVQSW